MAQMSCHVYQRFWRRVIRDGMPMNCHWCGVVVSRQRVQRSKYKATIDHVQPLAKGGSNNKENLVIACYPCNQRRGRMLALADEGRKE